MNNVLSDDGLTRFLDGLTRILNKHKPLLDQYGIEKIDCLVVGGGDSGDVSELKVVPESVDLKQMLPDENDTRVQRSLGYRIEGMVFEMVNGVLPGWEINEGSSHDFSIDVSKRTIDVSSTVYSNSDYNLLVPHALIKQDSGVEDNGAIRVGRLSDVNPELYRLCVDNHIVEIYGQILGLDDGEKPGFWQVMPTFDQSVVEPEHKFMEKHTRSIAWPTAEDLKSNQEDLNLNQLAAYRYCSYPTFDRQGKRTKSATNILVDENASLVLFQERWEYDPKVSMAVRVDTLHVGPKLLHPMYDWVVERLKEKLDSAEDGWPDDVDTEISYHWVVADVVNDEIRVGSCGLLRNSETFEIHVKANKE